MGAPVMVARAAALWRQITATGCVRLMDDDWVGRLHQFELRLAALEDSLDRAVASPEHRRFVHSSRGMGLAPFAVAMALPKARYALYYRCHGWLLALGASERQVVEAVTSPASLSPMQPRILGLPVSFISVTVGAQLPVALGLALDGNGPVVGVIGDGGLSTGVAFETLNAAALLRPDLLFVVEDNGRVVSSPSHRVLAADVRSLAGALSMEYFLLSPTDAIALSAAKDWIGDTSGSPRILHVSTTPLDAHCLAMANPGTSAI